MQRDTPSIFSVSPYSGSVARDMYPGQLGQDDQQDAARHMLAAGTMARKYGPTVADLAGRAHEYADSPLKALMMLLGRGQMPPDYEQDLHNNALGIEMAKRAQSQRDLEDLIQSMAEQSATSQTQGRPWVNKARGGQVHGYQAGGIVKRAAKTLGEMVERYAAPAASDTAKAPGTHSGVLNQWISEQPEAAAMAINRNRMDGAPKKPGFAVGGQVSGANFPTGDFDPDRIDAIVGELHAMNAA